MSDRHADEPQEPITEEEEQAEAWEYWHGRAMQAEADVHRLREAMREIADRRNVLAPTRNDYDSGYALGTELCCDIADDALQQKSDICAVPVPQE